MNPKNEQPADDPPASDLYDEIKDPGQILRWLIKAMEEEETVEVTANDRTRLFFTSFMDHLPELILSQTDVEETDQTDGKKPQEGDKGDSQPPTESVVEIEPPYERMSYLKERDHLLLAPLTPAIGNVHVRTAGEVQIRFFQGVKAIESTVQFISSLSVRGEPAIKLGFPTVMRVYRKRRHFRARVTPEVHISVSISRKKQPPEVVRLIDISVGGLAFCNPWPEEELAKGDPLTLRIDTGRGQALKIQAFVRNHARASVKEGCLKGQGRCGVQFDVMSDQTAADVGEIATYVQREFLHEIQERKKEVCEKIIAKPNSSSFSGELSKFFSLKSKFHI